MRRWIDLALADGPGQGDPDLAEVLESVLFANMVSLVTGRRAPDELGDALERAVRVIVP